MKITKDEAYILSYILDEAKYDIVQNRDNKHNLFAALSNLQVKLDLYSVDLRRIGRKSQNSFSDVLRRFIDKYK